MRFRETLRVCVLVVTSFATAQSALAQDPPAATPQDHDHMHMDMNMDMALDMALDIALDMTEP